jgi:GNAT superfamily N-acetyltransferase
MDDRDEAPIACTLQAGDYQERLAWIADLARDGLLDASREDLRLELYADGALLRSVVVDASAQGQGLGHRLTEAALTLATDRGASVVFLLTTTAAQFFPRFGFEPISRDDVPESVRQSVEFQSRCPASAVVMRHRMGRVQ